MRRCRHQPPPTRPSRSPSRACWRPVRPRTGRYGRIVGIRRCDARSRRLQACCASGWPRLRTSGTDGRSSRGVETIACRMIPFWAMKLSFAALAETVLRYIKLRVVPAAELPGGQRDDSRVSITWRRAAPQLGDVPKTSHMQTENSAFRGKRAEPVTSRDSGRRADPNRCDTVARCREVLRIDRPLALG